MSVREKFATSESEPRLSKVPGRSLEEFTTHLSAHLSMHPIRVASVTRCRTAAVPPYGQALSTDRPPAVHRPPTKGPERLVDDPSRRRGSRSALPEAPADAPPHKPPRHRPPLRRGARHGRPSDCPDARMGARTDAWTGAWTGAWRGHAGAMVTGPGAQTSAYGRPPPALRRPGRARRRPGESRRAAFRPGPRWNRGAAARLPGVRAEMPPPGVAQPVFPERCGSDAPPTRVLSAQPSGEARR